MQAIPRVSGGVSKAYICYLEYGDYSPRQRGCFQHLGPMSWDFMLFPASAGVFPRHLHRQWRSPTIPRVSGGVSLSGYLRRDYPSYSPRQRGCFPIPQVSRDRRRLFPASAGVFPIVVDLTEDCFAIPRVSGGVSYAKFVFSANTLYSPRQRGCFRYDISITIRL